MKKYPAVIIIFLLLHACTESVIEKKEPTPVTSSTTKIPENLDGCYEMIIASDTAFMKIEQNNNTVNGTLKYKRKDKDSNTGNIILNKISNRAEGYYTFESEGKTSVRQIIFKINNNSFAEAYGDIEMKSDTAVYKYPHALNFEEKHSFNKVDCK